MTYPVTTELERIGALIDLQRFQDAAARARQLLASEPNNADAACLLAQSEIGSDNPREALHAAQIAMASQPDSEWAHRLASHALSGLGEREAAVFEAREAVRLAPQLYAAHVRLGECLVTAGRPTEAQQHAERALELAPSSPNTHRLVGYIAYTEGRLEDAEEAYRRALAIQPDDAAALNELARIRLKKSGRGFRGGTMADAASAFAAAARVEPGSQVIRRNLELVTIGFLRKTAYLVFLAAWLGEVSGSNSSSGHSSGTAVFALILLALPAVYAARFVTRLPKSMRGFLLDVVTRRPIILAAVTLELVAVCCIVAAVATAQSTSRALAVIAAVAAIGARLLLWFHHDRTRKAT